jgi:hypothetical protein
MRDVVRKSRGVCLDDESAVGAAIISTVRRRLKCRACALSARRAAASLPLLSYLGGTALAL